MSLNSEEVFGLAIDQTMKDWKSFQLCVEQGMGGQYTREKLVWMVDTISDFFKTNANIAVEEVVHFVAEIIDNEFDTIIEDGSIGIFASNVCKYYQLCSSGRQQEVIDNLQDIKQRNSVSTDNSLQQNDNQFVVENSFKLLNISDESQLRAEESDPESDGWTRVQRKARK